MALIGIGYRALSMSPASIGPVKAMVLALDAGRLAAEVDRLIDRAAPGDGVHEGLRLFAARNNIPV